MIQIIISGGAVDKLDNENIIKSSFLSDVSIHKHLNKITNLPDYRVNKICVEKSLFVTSDNLKTLLKAIILSGQDEILIFFCSRTIIEVAKFLGKLKLGKRIVITGAFISETMPNTDAMDNLEFAIKEFSNINNAGVYVAIHNESFLWNNVTKKNTENRFEKVRK